ncbi:uncharacterized protein LOC135217324 [Macrobrachium nipponense]|uniref:uncharacterized protein LOC135217324 n=1 Tax=Macrobrachium nipponense TaxID=159736 RepID=UPI0030C7FA40
MQRAVIFLTLATLAVAESDFSEKYSFTKVMASCFGQDTYYKYLATVGTAQRECQQLPVSSLQTVGYPVYPQSGYLHSQDGYSPYMQHPPYQQGHSGPILGSAQGYPQYHGTPQGYPQYQGPSHGYPHYQPQTYPQEPSVPIYYPQQHGQPQTYPQYSGVPNAYPQHHGPRSYSHYLQKRESVGPASTVAPVSTEAPLKKPFFDQYYLLDAVSTITASLSNYTCVLHKLGFIDQYLNLRVDNYIQYFNIKSISQELKKDLADGAAYCRDLTSCLPLERLKSPLPLNLQRLLLEMKCEKETRTDACFKEALRKNIHEFNLSLFPKNDTQESKLDKHSAIVLEADSLDELQII